MNIFGRGSRFWGLIEASGHIAAVAERIVGLGTSSVDRYLVGVHVGLGFWVGIDVSW